MKEHDATEIAYKNGYEAGKRDARKTGRWEEINPRKDVEGWIEFDYLCSVCGEVSWEEHNFCPNCGADMR